MTWYGWVINLAGVGGSFCLSKWLPTIRNYNQSQSCAAMDHFPQNNHSELAANVVGLLPSWPQPSDLHWGWPSLFSNTESIYFRLRHGLAQSPTCEHADQLSLQANNAHGAVLKAQPHTEESAVQPGIPGPKGSFSLKAIWKKWQGPACCVCQFVPPCLTSFVCGN